jgi:hypothetical protein
MSEPLTLERAVEALQSAYAELRRAYSPVTMREHGNHGRRIVYAYRLVIAGSGSCDVTQDRYPERFAVIHAAFHFPANVLAEAAE